MNRKVAILGKRNVGSAIAKGLDGKPYDVRKVGNEPERVRETAAWGDIIVLAVPFDAVNPVVNEIVNAADAPPNSCRRRHQKTFSSATW